MSSQLGVVAPSLTGGQSSSVNSSSAIFHGAGPRRSSTGRRMSVAVIDVSSFGAVNFQPEYYLQFNMDDDTAESIGGMRRSLEQAREKAVGDLQKTVHSRHTEFVQITKELAGFESKMNELHSIINQLGTLGETLLANVPQCSDMVGLETRMDTLDDVMDPGREAVQTSALTMAGVDLVERRANISRLLEHVSDLDEFLAESTGRYIIFEGADLDFLSSGKTAKPIYLYLLNDTLLASSKKASRNPLGASGKKRHGLEFRLSFSELSLEDIKEPIPDPQGKQSPQFGLRLLRNKTEPVGTILFDSAATKKLWIDQIKRAIIAFKMEEAALNSTLHMAPVKERYIKKAGKSSLAARAGHRRAASSSAHRRAAEHAVATAGQTDLPDDKFESLLYLLDDLDRVSALRKYDDAIELVGQVDFNLDHISLSDSPRIHTIRQGLESRKRHFAELLLAEISSPLVDRQDTIRFVQFLIVLGYADAARERFLTARSDTLHRLIRSSMQSVGDAKKTVSDLTEAIFPAIKTTADWYRAAFNDPVRMSGLVFWTRVEILELGGLLVKLLLPNAESANTALIAECLEIVRRGIETLTEVGLSFSFLIDECFAKPLNDLMEAKASQVKTEVTKAVLSEAGTPVPSQ